MKIRVDSFKGEAPRIDDTKIGNSYARSAQNTRLRSGALDSYFENSNSGFSASANATTIYGMEEGTCWLNWEDTDYAAGRTKVDVARGFVKNDTTERTYFTGSTAGPRVTDTNEVCGDRIANSDPIGVVTFRDIVDQDASFNDVAELAPVATYDFSSVVVTQERDYSALLGGDWTFGDLASESSGLLSLDETSGNLTTEAFAYTNRVKFTGVPYVKFSFTHTWNPVGATPADYQPLMFYVSVDDSGNGDAIAFTPINTTQVTVVSRAASGFGRPGKSAPTTTIYGPITPSVAGTQDWTVEIVPASDDSIMATNDRDMIITAVGIGSVTIPITLTENDIFGFASGNSPFDTTNDPAEVSAITVDFSGENALATNYIYTLVNSRSEEGVPSPVGNDILVSYDEYATTVSLADSVQNIDNSIITAWDINSVRLYRAETSSAGETEYLFVEEKTLAQLVTDSYLFTDNISSDSVGPDVLESFGWVPPPSDAHSIVALANGIMVVASGQTLYPSVSFRPHAYPVANSIAVDSDIVTLVAVENQAVVLTNTSAYILFGDDPSAMTLSAVPQKYGCLSQRSAAFWPKFGVVYASTDGLVAIAGNQAVLLTEQYLTKREWDTYDPENITAVVHDDVYYFWNTTEGHVFDPRDGNIGLSTLDFVAKAAYSNPYDDKLYFTLAGNTNIQLFEGNTSSKRQYNWLSKRFLMPYPMSLEAGIIRVEEQDDATPDNLERADDAVTLKVYRDKESTPYFTLNIPAGGISQEFVMPDKVAREVCFSLEGTGKVYYLELSDNMMELT